MCAVDVCCGWFVLLCVWVSVSVVVDMLVCVCVDGVFGVWVLLVMLNWWC